MYLAQFFKNRDAFGHEFKLRMSHKQLGETEQKSALGGFVTLVIVAVCSSFLGVQISKMVNGSLDNISQNTNNANFDELKSVYMHGVMPVIMFNSENQNPLEYFTIKISQYSGLDEVVENSQRNFRNCTLQDFQRFGLNSTRSLEGQLCVDKFEEYHAADGFTNIEKYKSFEIIIE